TAAIGKPPTRKDGPETRGLAAIFVANCSVTLRLAARPNAPSQVQSGSESGSKTSQAEAGSNATVAANVKKPMTGRPRSANPAPRQIQDRIIAFRRIDVVEGTAASEGYSVDIGAALGLICVILSARRAAVSQQR